MRYWYSIILVVVWCHTGLAQHQPRINQLFLNPFAYNPAYLGDRGYVEASLSHRRQWVGIQGAPTTSWFTLQVPTDHRLAVGLNIVDDRYGPIATTSALATVGYSVPFSEVSYLRFGLSGGLGTRRVDLSQLDDPNDPLLSVANDQRSHLDGSFGVHYRYAKFNVGIALPRLFNHSLVSEDTHLETRLGQFNHFIAQTGYKIDFPLSHWSLHPQVLYHINDQVRQAEGLLVATYKQHLWGGASYRQSDTWAGLVGVRLYRRAKLGYAYELPGQNLAFGATHELTLHWQFGRKRKINKPGRQPQKQMERKIRTLLAQKPPPKMKPQLARPAPTVVVPVAPERVARTVAAEDSGDLAPGSYIVAGTFSNEANAQNQQRQWTQQGYTAQYGYSSGQGYYYVYLEKHATSAEAFRRVKQLQQTDSLKDAWVLIVE